MLAAILLPVGNGLATPPVHTTVQLPNSPTPAALSPPPRLGALVPLTGGLSLFGPGMANAVNLVGEQANASGGIRGTNLSVYVADSQTDPTAASAAASDLVQNKGVQAIVGDAYAGGTLAAFQVTQPAGVVLMSPSASSVVLSTVDSVDLLWRTTASDRLEGKAAASLAYTNFSYHKIGIMAPNSAYGRAVGDSFKENFTALGGTISIEVLYTEYQPDHSADVTVLFSTNPDAVFLVAYPPDGTVIIQNWWANHAAWPTHWILTDGMDDQTTFDQLRSAGVNTTGFTGLAPTRSTNATSLDAYARFQSDYVARFGQQPTYYSENAYDAAFVLALAMYVTNSSDPSEFRAALRYVANPPGVTILPGQWAEAVAAIDAGENIDYWGAANRVDFDRFGDTGTSYAVWLINETGVIGTSSVLDESLFWTPAPEDALPVHVDITAPSAGAFLAGLATIRGTASATSGIVSVEVAVDGGVWQAATGTATWTFDLNTTALTDGPHQIGARSFDGAHYSLEATVDVTVDNTPPELTIEPLPPIVTHSGVTLTWTGSDATSGIHDYAISVDGGPFASVGTVTAKPLVLADGDHTIRVRAIDGAGHNVTDSVSFRVDTNVFSFSGPYAGAPTVAIPIVIIAIALVFFWRRSRIRRGGAGGTGP